MAAFIKPTLATKFHIDFDWWQKQARSLRVYLFSHLCATCAARYADSAPHPIDWVDPYTGEVKQVDVLWDVIRDCCSHQDDFTTPQTPLAVAALLTFIANDNMPLTPVELHETISIARSPEIILRTLGGRQVYYGIRPVRTSLTRKRRVS
jgi:hypothetical protein